MWQSRSLSLTAIICAILPTIASPAAARQRTGEESPGACVACHVGGGEVSYPQVEPEPLRRGVHRAFVCVDCHRGLTATHGPDVPPVDCAACHTDSAEGFRRGVHWRERQRRNLAAPTCAGCHGSHGIEAADALESSVNHDNVALTCGGCHGEQLRLFEASTHGSALADEGKRSLAPTCTTCHGEHVIHSASAPASTVSPGRLPRTCGGCHEDPRVAGLLGIPSERLSTYRTTVHGQRNRFGVSTVADCADCHGIHLVLPPDNPESTIAEGNIVATCGRCHPGANENFVRARIHVEATPESSIGVFIVRWFYIVFIGLLGVGFVAHIIFDLVTHRRRPRESRNE